MGRKVQPAEPALLHYARLHIRITVISRASNEPIHILAPKLYIFYTAFPPPSSARAPGVMTTLPSPLYHAEPSIGNM